jgi:hypothetical protein
MKTRKPKMKNYTLQLPESYILRLWYLRDISNKNFDPNVEIKKAVKEILEKNEKHFHVDRLTYIKSPKCDKCGSAMRKVIYKGKNYWGCVGFPDCKNLKEIQNES